MEPTRDRPTTPFNAYLTGIGLFLLFAALLALILVFKGKPAATPDDVRRAERLEIRQAVEAEQAAFLNPEAVEAVLPTMAASLAGSPPVAVERPEQVVPGSATALALADAAPTTDAATIEALTPEADAPIDPAVLELGKASYMICAACHGQNGEGGPIAPPLGGSKRVHGPVGDLILIQLRGLVGPVMVDGDAKEYVGGMAPMAYQTDEQIAAVLTFVRNSFGNQASAVLPEQVAQLRGEVGKPQIHTSELTPLPAD